MAGRSITTRIALEGSDEIKRSLESLGKSGADAFDKIKQSGDRLNFDNTGRAAQNLGRSLAQTGQAGAQAGQQIAQSFEQTQRQIDATEGSSSNFGRTFALAAAGIAAAAVAIGVAVQRAIGAMVEAAATANDKLQEAAEKSGLSAQGYEKLANRIETAGGSAEKTISALQRLGASAADQGNKALGAAKANEQHFGVLRSISGAADTATGSVEKLNSAGTVTKSTYDIVSESAGKATVNVIRFGAEAKKTADVGLSGTNATLHDLGVNLKSFATADDAARLEQLRAAFQKIKDPLRQNELAARLFGAEWRSMLDVLKQTKQEAADADKTLIESGRQLSVEQRKNLTDYSAATKELQTALSATKEKIAAIFAPGATRRAEWLTQLIDESRNWLLQLAEVKSAQLDTFFNDRGGKAFILDLLKSAGAFAADFVRVITSLVLPALRALAGGFQFAAEKINETFGTSISGRFLAIAVGVGVLTGAFGLLGAIMAPIVAVVGGIIAAFGGLGRVLLVGGVGARTFWTDLRAGAQKALGFIKGELPNVQKAFSLLFKGDFKGAWAEFAALGARAFAAVKEGLFGVEGVFAGLAQHIRSAFTVVMGVLNVFAKILNAVFGTSLTGSTLGFNLLLIQMSGIFGALIPVISGALLIFSKLGGAFFAIGAAVIVLARMFPNLGKSWQEVTAAFDSLIKGDFAKALDHLSTAFAGFWTNLSKQGAGTWAVLGLGALALVSKLLGPSGFGGLAALFLRGGLVGLAIAGLATLAFQNWDAIVAYAKRVFPQIGAALAESVPAFFDLMQRGATNLWAAIVADAEERFPRMWENIKADAQQRLDAIKQFFADLWTNIVEDAKTRPGVMWDNLKADAQSRIESIRDFFVALWDNLVADAKTRPAQMWDAIVTDAQSRIDAIKGYFTAKIDEIVAYAQQKFPLLFGKAEQSAAQGSTFFEDLWKHLFEPDLGKFEDLKGKFDRLWRELGVGSAQAATDTTQNLSAITQGADPFAPLMDRARAAFDFIKTGAADAAQAIQAIGAAQSAAGPSAAPAAGAGLFQPMLDAIATAQQAFDAFAQGLGERVGAINQSLAGIVLPSSLAESANAIADQIAQAFGQLPQAIASAFSTMADLAGQAFQTLGGTVDQAMQGIMASVSAMVASVSAQLDALAQQIAAVNASAASAGGGGDSSGGSAGFASGGFIRGPGTGTSDSILARLSNGEFVMRAAAVRRFGPDFFRMLNALRLPKFATGGLVNALAMPSMSMAPAFAGSGFGANTSLAPVHLTIGGETITGLLAPDDVVGKLATFANRSKMRAAGKKPSWFGG